MRTLALLALLVAAPAAWPCIRDATEVEPSPGDWVRRGDGLALVQVVRQTGPGFHEVHDLALVSALRGQPPSRQTLTTSPGDCGGVGFGASGLYLVAYRGLRNPFAAAWAHPVRDSDDPLVLAARAISAAATDEDLVALVKDPTLAGEVREQVQRLVKSYQDSPVHQPVERLVAMLEAGAAARPAVLATLISRTGDRARAARRDLAVVAARSPRKYSPGEQHLVLQGFAPEAVHADLGLLLDLVRAPWPGQTVAAAAVLRLALADDEATLLATLEKLDAGAAHALAPFFIARPSDRARKQFRRLMDRADEAAGPSIALDLAAMGEEQVLAWAEKELAAPLAAPLGPSRPDLRWLPAFIVARSPLARAGELATQVTKQGGERARWLREGMDEWRAPKQRIEELRGRLAARPDLPPEQAAAK